MKQITERDLIILGTSELESKGLVNHHIISGNHYYDEALEEIIENVFEIDWTYQFFKKCPENDNIININLKVNFLNTKLENPTTRIYASGLEVPIYPMDALTQNKTYSGSLYVDVKIILTANMKDGTKVVKNITIPNKKLCKIPIMVKSNKCNLYNLSNSALNKLNENTDLIGGYFIIKGVEWAIEGVESVIFNYPRIFKNMGYGKEVCRLEILTKNGNGYKNSYQLIIRLLNNNELTIEIVRAPLKGIYFPFYLILRLLGCNNDQEIFNKIINNYNTEKSKKLRFLLLECFNAKYTNFPDASNNYNITDIIDYLTKQLKDKFFKNYSSQQGNKNILYNKLTSDKIFKGLDDNFLTNIGTTEKYRKKKILMLCIYIRKVLETHLNYLPQTDRDCYTTKRILSAGLAYSKSFKTLFNASIILKIRKNFQNNLNSLPFDKINLSDTFNSSIYGTDFERLVTNAITMGITSQLKIGLRNKSITNNLSTQLLNRQNQLATLYVLRQISTTSNEQANQSERAKEMRRVHLSTLGYIDCLSSPVSHKVGINKQLSIFATVLLATTSELIIDKIEKNDNLIPLSKIEDNLSLIYSENLWYVYVNGNLIGFVKDGIHFTTIFRNKRRNMELHSYYITIYYKELTREVHFWCDMGRVTRPLLIVYNNKRDPEFFTKKEQAQPFMQKILLTDEHINGLLNNDISIEYLVKEKIIEYITPGEQLNCHIAFRYNKLLENQNNITKEYTHCDIPQSICGLPALTSPAASHNDIPRTVYQTNQCKQACGYYMKNWAHRTDKESFIQYVNEKPLVRTFSNNYCYPNGMNIIVALMCNSGYNQEDSIIINAGALDRGLYLGCKFIRKSSNIEQKEKFCIPNINITKNIKSANYSKLMENGIIQNNIIVNNGDVIIGKVFEILQTNNSEKYTYIDKSIVYKEKEPGYIHNVILGRNEDDIEFCKVIIRKIRKVDIGDKFCILPSSLILTDKGWVTLEDINIKEHKVATLKDGKYLDYVYPTNKYEFECEDDELYHLDTQQIKITCTKNHKLFIKKRNKTEFEFIEAKNAYGKRVRFKKDAINNNKDISVINLNGKEYNMDNYLKVLGAFISDGSLDIGKKYKRIKFSMTKKRKHKFLGSALNELNVKYYSDDNRILVGNTYKEIVSSLSKLSVGATNKFLPEWIWDLSQRQSIILLEALLQGDGSYNKNNSAGYFTSSYKLANDVQRLALHCGWSGTIKLYKGREKGRTSIMKDGRIIKSNSDNLCIRIIKKKNNPQINHGHTKEQNRQIEKYIKYTGKVGCIEVPDTHLFYYKEDKFSPPIWSGNSSRHG